MINMKNVKGGEPVLQFLIVLLGVDPLVWHRMGVPPIIAFGICMLQSKMRWAGLIIASMSLS